MLHVLLFFSTYISGLLLTFISAPVFAFVLYQAVYFFHPSGRWWSFLIPTLSYSFFTVVLMMTALVLHFKDHNKNKLLASPPIKWMYLVLLSYGLAYFWAVLPVLHHDALINFVKLVVTMSIAYKLIDTCSKLDFVLWGYIFGCWYVSLLTWQTGRNSGDRVEGIGTVDSSDANGIAAALAPSLVLCLYYFWLKKGRVSKVLFTLAGAFIANAIILINSRGAMLAVVVSILYFMGYMYFSTHKVRFQKLVATCLIVTGLSGVIVLADESFVERVQSIFEEKHDTSQETASTRTIFWAAAWQMTKDYPLGLGFQGFNYYAPVYIPEDVDTGASRNRTVHSTWFEALSEIGYFGFACLMGMLVSCFKCTKKCKKLLLENKNTLIYYKVIAIEAGLIAFIFAMSFLNRLRAEILYWFVLFCACAYNIYVIKKELSGASTIGKTDEN